LEFSVVADFRYRTRQIELTLRWQYEETIVAFVASRTLLDCVFE
jgi:hypothetical protein